MATLRAGAVRQLSQQRFFVSQAADVGAVRRAVSGYAGQLQADQEVADRAALAATELASNLLQHALPGGWILARPLPPESVEILAVDHGPGIRDVAAALSGGSPRPGGSPQPGGLGCGLAATVRVSSEFGIDTCPGRGTTVLAVVTSAAAARAARRSPQPTRCWAGVSVGLDKACGDGWAVAETGSASTVAVVDGLGHGVNASLAADAALAVLADDPADLDGYLARANAAMRDTRGAAVMVCRLEPDHGEMRCLSVGNVSGSILCQSGPHAIVATRGAVGSESVPPRARITCYPWPPGAVLALWTDGLASHIDLARYAGLCTRDPAIAAAALHRDYSTERDDSTVVVVRNGASP